MDEGLPYAQRIVVVLHDFVSGGTERVAIRLANEWASTGRDVSIFCGTEAGPTRHLVEAGVRVGSVRPATPRSLFSRYTLGSALADHVKDAPSDIVFAPGNFHLPVLARFVAIAGTDATTVCKLSNPVALATRIPLIRAIHARSLRALARPIDTLIAMSPALQAQAAWVLGRDDIGLGWEPILTDPGASPRAMGRERPTGRPFLLAAGRLEPQKNLGLALEAFARSSAASVADFVLLGEGSERKALTRLARRLGIVDRVRMPGYQEDIQEYLRQATALLLTSRYEGYPAILVEAVAAGVPVISTACSPAIPEILNPTLDTLVDADPDAFAAAIDRVMVNDFMRSALPPSELIARHQIKPAAAAYLRLLDEARVASLLLRHGSATTSQS